MTALPQSRDDIARYRSALFYLDPNMQRGDWFKAACGFKDGGGALDEFDAWSEGGETYDKADTRDMWKSIRPGGYTAASLIAMAKDAGWKDDGKYQRPTAVEMAQREAEIAQRREQDAKQKTEREAIGAERANTKWNEAEPANEHPYLIRKGVKAHGLRVGRWEKFDQETGQMRVVSDEALLVPIRDASKSIHSLQAIFPSKDNVLGRDRDYLTWGAKEGHFFTIGKPKNVADQMVIAICTGYATGASVHEATEHAVVIAFDDSNLLLVTKSIRERFPNADIIIFSDRDAEALHKSSGTKAALKAALAISARVVVPEWTGQKGRDANDIHLGGFAWRGTMTPGQDILDACVKFATPCRSLAFMAMLAECGIRADDYARRADADDRTAGQLEVVEPRAEAKAAASALGPAGPVEVMGVAPAAVAGTPNPEPQSIAAFHFIAPPEFSEDALALDYVARAANFRWSPGLGWMIDDGVTWSRDVNLQRYDLARRICRAAANQCDDDGEAKRITSARTVNATLALAQADPALVVPTSLWDADPMLLNTPGGVIDLRTGKRRERGIEFITQATRVAPDYTASCPSFHGFMSGVFLGDRDLIECMQRSMGYWVTGDRSEQVIHFLYGLGANGKSVLTEFMQWLAGSYSVKLQASALMQARGERHPTELAQLRGKRLAVSSELDENSFFNESLIKELTGDDTLSARFMRGDFFEFTMTQKHVIVGNFKPRLRGGDPAIARRMLLVPFNASFKGKDRDPRMLEKLKAEAPAILAWIIEGAMKWHVDGLAVPASVRDASSEYMADHDDLQQWVDACCERKGESAANDLYRSFSNWKKDRGENPPSQTTWGSRLTALSGITKRKSSGIKYSGVQLTDHENRRLGWRG